MSKYVKNLITEHVRERLHGVHDAILVNMVGLDAKRTHRVRSELLGKNIQVLMVKNSLAARALAGTPLAPVFEGLTGSAAICWGAEDVVALAKEVTRLARDKRFQPFAPVGGVMDGEKVSAQDVEEVATWPTREQQVGMLIGQILSPGSRLVAQILGPAARLAGQIAEKTKGLEIEQKEFSILPLAANQSDPK